MPSTDVVQLILTLKVTTAQVVELKHQTFLIHERHGWPRRTGSGTQFACQMQITKQNNVKHHERRQNNSVENALQRFALSFVSLSRRKHDFR